MIYSVVEAAEKAGLAVATVKNYCRPGYSDLVRDLDFFVRRWKKGCWLRKEIKFTERGLQRLAMRQYKVYRPDGIVSPSARRFAQTAALAELKLVQDRSLPLPSRGQIERRMRVRDEAFRVARLYIESPCAVPGCPCMAHKLGLPQADALVELMGR